MKKLLILFALIAFVGCNDANGNEITAESSGLNEWQKAYKQALLDFMDSDEYNEHSDFSLYDISADGIPELIISPDTTHFSACSVYTYDNEPIFLGKMGTYGNIGYYNTDNIIMLFNQGQGIETYVFCELKNNEILYLDSFYNDEFRSRSEQATYKYNDTEVTKEEYDKELKKYNDSEFIWLGLDYSFDEMNDVLGE